MMNNQNQIQLNIGDQIGFVSLAQDVDSNDNVVFFAVVEITNLDGERAYRYQYPDGQISRRTIKQSELGHYTLRINRLQTIAPKPEPQGICLHDRKDEFRSALKRGADNNLEVFAGWDKDTFFVVNQSNGTEYGINFETVDGKVYAECDCPDFIHRKRICKHIAETLKETYFGIGLAV